ncbi:hypothetical protein [Desulfobotulus mexicanus]|uniref:Uncharacterized protein n=1 Tax=Desulfobotulus mexicanus TaxID=2586642 RepID=A0A5S5MEP0_9BACT|nr:hypothetical protein [Desulfobotulus mexicanus]TYT74193.1 hypothetical protein FIM25_11455 [Desulfobotulus mexicanus]
MENLNEKKEIGKAIHQSAQLIAKAGQEIESMMDLIKLQFEPEIASLKKDPKIYVSENWLYSWIYDDAGWVCMDYSISLGLGKSTKKHLRYLCIQVSLMGEGMSCEKAPNKEPLVHVCLFGDLINYDEENFMGPDLSNEEDEKIILQNDFFINWSSEASTWEEQAWAFTLRLTSLNSASDIQEKIIKPVIALLKGHSLERIGLEKIDGIVKYEEVEKFVFKPIIHPES